MSNGTCDEQEHVRQHSCFHPLFMNKTQNRSTSQKGFAKRTIWKRSKLVHVIVRNNTSQNRIRIWQLANFGLLRQCLVKKRDGIH